VNLKIELTQIDFLVILPRSVLKSKQTIRNWIHNLKCKCNQHKRPLLLYLPIAIRKPSKSKIKLIHSSWSLQGITSEIENIGHSVRNVFNIKHYQIKSHCMCSFLILNHATFPPSHNSYRLKGKLNCSMKTKNT